MSRVVNATRAAGGAAHDRPEDEAEDRSMIVHAAPNETCRNTERRQLVHRDADDERDDETATRISPFGEISKSGPRTAQGEPSGRAPGGAITTSAMR